MAHSLNAHLIELQLDEKLVTRGSGCSPPVGVYRLQLLPSKWFSSIAPVVEPENSGTSVENSLFATQLSHSRSTIEYLHNPFIHAC